MDDLEKLQFEEYKILEVRYQSDVQRVWNQANILIAANIAAISILTLSLSVLTRDLNDSKSIVLYSILGLLASGLGIGISVVWRRALRIEQRYLKFDRNLLQEIEKNLDLPIKQFTRANKEKENFPKAIKKKGVISGLKSLSVFLIIIWLVIFFSILIMFIDH